MNLFRFLLRASWRTVALASILGAVSGLASIGLIALVHRALREPSAVPGWVVWTFAALCGLVLLTKVFSQILLTNLAQHAISKLCLHLCDRILAVPLRKLETLGSHRLLAALTGDVMMIAQALNGMPTLCVSGIILVCGLFYLAWLSLPLLIATLVFLAGGIASYRVSARGAQRHLRLGREEQDVLVRHIRNLIDGAKELKLHHDRREAFLHDVLASADGAVREHHIKGFTIQATAVNWGRLLFFIGIGLLLFLWPRVQTVDGATLTGYTLTILYLMSPLERIMAWLPFLSRARVALRKVDELGLALDSEEAEQTGTLMPISKSDFNAWQRLELVGVTHAYQREGHDRPFTLGPIDFALQPGELVFIVGGNGSGKTTLAKLLAGLYVPEQGEIRVDEVAIGAGNRETYRQLFSVVFAEAMLFDSLLGLAPGGDSPAALDARARQYLIDLQLDHEVRVTDGVFTTTELSKGQRKRLALLTACLEDRPIYLFDEWAADQDPLFKDVFYRRILPDLKARGKALLVISHDDRYFSTADRVLTLRDGKMAETAWDSAGLLDPQGEILTERA